MSLELYHHGSSACAAKVRFALAEKHLPWVGHYVDILAGEQFKPEYWVFKGKAPVSTIRRFPHSGGLHPKCIPTDERIVGVGRSCVKAQLDIVNWLPSPSGQPEYQYEGHTPFVMRKRERQA
jgi:hypothetical protein